MYKHIVQCLYLFTVNINKIPKLKLTLQKWVLKLKMFSSAFWSKKGICFRVRKNSFVLYVLFSYPLLLTSLLGLSSVCYSQLNPTQKTHYDVVFVGFTLLCLFYVVLFIFLIKVFDLIMRVINLSF